MHRVFADVGQRSNIGRHPFPKSLFEHGLDSIDDGFASGWMKVAKCLVRFIQDIICPFFSRHDITSTIRMFWQ